jgi:N-acetyl-anhydromuramyl-L-alanine amidase AmpD
MPPVVDYPAAPANYGARGSATIDTIVIHTTQAGPNETAVRAADIMALFADPAQQISAHFVVGQDGQIWQCVPLDRAAWHAGHAGANRRSVGIECEGDCRDSEMWTPELLASLGALLRWLCAEHQVPADRRHLIGHVEVPDPHDPTQVGGLHHHKDPGPHCPWPAILAAASEAAPADVA